jgi:hypothetical protein
MKKIIYVFIINIGIFFFCNSNASEIKIATSEIKPLCYDSNNGFSIFVLKEIENFTKFTFITKNFPSVTSKLQSVINNESDIAICGISDRSDRRVNTESIHIMETRARALSLVDNSFFSEKNTKKFITILFVIIIAGILLKLVEKFHQSSFFKSNSITNFLFSPKLKGGEIESIEEAINTIFKAITVQSTRETNPKTRLGNWAIFWPVVLFGMVTLAATFGNFLLSKNEYNAKININSIEDLRLYKIATKEGTIYVDNLKKDRIKFESYKTTKEMYKALLDGKVDLIVYDELSLQNYTLNNPKVTTVGPGFYPQDYRWYFPRDSKYKAEIDSAVLKIKETGIFEKLKETWFGK